MTQSKTPIDRDRLARARGAAAHVGRVLLTTIRRLMSSTVARQLKVEALDVRRTLRSVRSDSFEARYAERARAVEQRRRRVRRAGQQAPDASVAQPPPTPKRDSQASRPSA